MTRRAAIIGTMMMAAAAKIVSADQIPDGPFTLIFDFTIPQGLTALVLKFPDKTLTITREELQREMEQGAPCGSLPDNATVMWSRT